MMLDMRAFLKHEALAIMLIFILTLPTVKAFATPGFYTSHDGDTHTARLANFFLAIKEGQLPPRLAPTLFGGYGFPIFIFIYPLPYLVGSFAHFVGFSYTDSTELVMVIGQLLSAILMYLFFKVESRNTLTSILAALIFTWAPYRFLMLFVRGAFAESFAYIFVASTFLALHRLVACPNKHSIGLASLSLACLLLSHQLVSAMFLPVFVWYLFTKIIHHPHKILLAKSAFFVFILSFVTSAYIYLPSFFERQYLRFDSLINYYQDHFVTLKQLFHSPWSYGFSHQGVANDDMSFQVGLTHLVIVVLALLSLLITLVRSKFKTITRTDQYLLLWFIPFGLSILVMLEHPLVYQLWTYTPGLNIIDFPWRFLGVSVTTISFITLYLLKKTHNHLILVLFIGLFIFYANRNHLRINQTVFFPDDYFEFYPATATWRNEFLPKARITNKWSGIEGDYHLERGEANFIPLENKTQTLEISAQVAQPSDLVIHRLFFPGWQVYLDGQLLSPGDDLLSVTDASLELRTGIDYSGFLKLSLTPGSHIILAQFIETPLRKLGMIMTGLGLIFSIFLSTQMQSSRYKQKN